MELAEPNNYLSIIRRSITTFRNRFIDIFEMALAADEWRSDKINVREV